MDDQIHALAQELYQQKSLLVMGRGYNYATCLEGALVRFSNSFRMIHDILMKFTDNYILAASVTIFKVFSR